MVMVGEPIVIKSELMQDRRMQVRHADTVLSRTIADFIGSAVNVARFEAATGEDRGEGVAIVIAAGSVLGNRQAAELA